MGAISNFKEQADAGDVDAYRIKWFKKRDERIKKKYLGKKYSTGKYLFFTETKSFKELAEIINDDPKEWLCPYKFIGDDESRMQEEYPKFVNDFSRMMKETEAMVYAICYK